LDSHPRGAAMQLPVTVVVEPPTLAEVTGLLRTWRGRLALLAAAGLLAAATVGAAWWLSQPAQPELEAGEAPLRLSSDPPGATVVVDGRPRGRTPVTLGVPPGSRTVLLHKDGWIDERRAL